MSSPRRRIETDVMKMLMSDYEVTLVNDNMQEFFVRFKGPAETPFEGGLWKVHVELPDTYPYKSPSIGFVNRIFHPNIDELSGSVCLDVINQTWSPMFDMINIFEVFLPQLLRYPNPTDPLNGEAAALLIREPKSYDAKVKEYVQKYANKDVVDEAGQQHNQQPLRINRRCGEPKRSILGKRGDTTTLGGYPSYHWTVLGQQQRAVLPVPFGDIHLAILCLVEFGWHRPTRCQISPSAESGVAPH